METANIDRIEKLYWKCFQSWNGKRKAFAKHKRKRLLAISTYQANRYFDKWAATIPFTKKELELLKWHWIR